MFRTSQLSKHGNFIPKNREIESTLNSSKIEGSFVHIGLFSELTLKSCKFHYGYGKNGGAIYLLGNSKLHISACEFRENKAYDTGGALFISNFE